MRTCKKCSIEKPCEEFTKRGKRTRHVCKECRNKTRDYDGKEYLPSLLSAAKTRAKKRGTPFEINATDIIIPTHCPLLGIELKKGKGSGGKTDTSPSLDCLIPEKGYVKGNILVVSDRANRIKNNATLSELVRLVNNLSFFIVDGNEIF